MRKAIAAFLCVATATATAAAADDDAQLIKPLQAELRLVRAENKLLKKEIKRLKAKLAGKPPGERATAVTSKPSSPEADPPLGAEEQKLLAWVDACRKAEMARLETSIRQTATVLQATTSEDSKRDKQKTDYSGLFGTDYSGRLPFSGHVPVSP